MAPLEHRAGPSDDPGGGAAPSVASAVEQVVAAVSQNLIPHYAWRQWPPGDQSGAAGAQRRAVRVRNRPAVGRFLHQGGMSWPANGEAGLISAAVDVNWACGQSCSAPVGMHRQLGGCGRAWRSSIRRHGSIRWMASTRGPMMTIPVSRHGRIRRSEKLRIALGAAATAASRIA